MPKKKPSLKSNLLPLQRLIEEQRGKESDPAPSGKTLTQRAMEQRDKPKPETKTLLQRTIARKTGTKE